MKVHCCTKVGCAKFKPNTDRHNSMCRGINTCLAIDVEVFEYVATNDRCEECWRIFVVTRIGEVG